MEKTACSSFKSLFKSLYTVGSLIKYGSEYRFVECIKNEGEYIRVWHRQAKFEEMSLEAIKLAKEQAIERNMIAQAIENEVDLALGK